MGQQILLTTTPTAATLALLPVPLTLAPAAPPAVPVPWTVGGTNIAISVLPGETSATFTHIHPFSIAISTADNSIEVGREVRIHVVETNVSTEEIAVPAPSETTGAESHYSNEISGPKSLVGQQGGHYGPTMKSLKPGEQIEEDGVLKGPAFGFNSPGEYAIQFFQKDGDDPNPWSVKSNKIMITVTE